MTGRGLLDTDMATLTAWAATGWRWWVAELADCVPPTWRQRTRLRLAHAEWDTATGRFVARSTGALAAVLPQGMALCRTIETPIMGERDLASMIALDARRLMPMGGDGAILGARIARRDPVTGRMQVEIATLLPDDAARVAAALGASARMPLRVYAHAPAASGAEPVDLLPALRRAGQVAGDARAAATVWLVVGFLFALNLGVLVWRDVAAVDALNAVVEQQSGAVSVAQRVIGRMRAQDRIVATALTARRTREPLAIMGRVAGALPKGAWLRKLTWTGSTVRVAGFHPHGTDVAGALRHAGFAVARYGDAGEAPTPLGEPFDATLGLKDQ